MVFIHNLGFPRVGTKRELKFAQEAYWKGDASEQDLLTTARQIRRSNWESQSQLDLIPIGDFSLYDQVLDMSFTLGNLPKRLDSHQASELDNYFRIARGRSKVDDCHCIRAGEMTKWFDTNYHYIVPELTAQTCFKLNAKRLLDQLSEAQKLHTNPKPVIIGPVSYLWLSKAKDDSNKLALIDQLIPIYFELIQVLAKQGVEWIQIDEPVLVTELASPWSEAFKQAYDTLKRADAKLLLTTFFGSLEKNIELALELPVAGLHIDVTRSGHEFKILSDRLSHEKILSLGVIDGRNIWKNDLNATLDFLEPIAKRRTNKLWIAPSCSLLHVPVDLENETLLEPEVRNWLSFAKQKIDELVILGKALNQGRDSVKEELLHNKKAIESRQHSKRVHNPAVKNNVNAISKSLGQRNSTYDTRSSKQEATLGLPLYPTTTIGSFPQTKEIRHARLQFKKSQISYEHYQSLMKEQIQKAVKEQEKLGLDVLVHGEAERNDMVEYFGEQLDGYIFSQFGWVQSYGSRCVKPPIIYGDVTRKKEMTVSWIKYAQSLTSKPMKGMLTGPVTMLNWSFVRDDQTRKETCLQLALAIRKEVLDLEAAGINIIQIDEAALREGLPLRKSEWEEYLEWAVESFRICANGVKDETQIHTHMCYSEFNDIIENIAKMDADVITIETSRSDMELLEVFEKFEYPNEIGPGVYDIHSPNIPTEQQAISLMLKASKRIPARRLWVNPDCGLKTRQWSEVIPALKNMVSAAKHLRNHIS